MVMIYNGLCRPSADRPNESDSDDSGITSDKDAVKSLLSLQSCDLDSDFPNSSTLLLLRKESVTSAGTYKG